MKTLYIATLRTPHFTFEAVAGSKDELEPALEAAWWKHADEHAGMRHELFSFEAVLEATQRPDSCYALEVREVTSGAVYRDGVLFMTSPPVHV